MSINKISLIALDIGGTLLSDDNNITENNIKTIAKAKELGVKVALVTAREYSSTRYISKQIQCDYGVFSNGSHVLDLNNMSSLKISYIESNAVLDIYDYCKSNNLYIHLNLEFSEVSDEMKYFNLKHNILNKSYPKLYKSACYLVDDLKNFIKNNKITKIVIVSENNLNLYMDGLNKILKKHSLNITEINENLYETAINKKINYLEIGSTMDSKASGLQFLVDTMNINQNQVVVFGDGINDIDMFKKFDNSVCMVNGTNELKKIAKYVTNNDNNSSGVAEGINYFLKDGDEIC